MGNINSKTTLVTTNNAGAVVASAPINATGDNESLFSQPITANTANQNFALTLIPSKLNLLRIDSDITLTIKTNSASAPNDTISVTGGTPILYPLTPLASVPLTVNIASPGIYVTTTSNVGGTLTIYSVSAL